MHVALFYTFGTLILVLTLAVVLARNPVHGLGFLVSALLLQAGVFALLGATFLAAIQVLIYAGAILVLFLFVVMLIPLEEGDLDRPRPGPVAIVGAIILLVEIVVAVRLAGAPSLLPGGTGGSVAEVGREIFTGHAVPLEILSLLLLAAIVGAVTLARRRTA